MRADGRLFVATDRNPKMPNMCFMCGAPQISGFYFELPWNERLMHCVPCFPKIESMCKFRRRVFPSLLDRRLRMSESDKYNDTVLEVQDFLGKNGADQDLIDRFNDFVWRANDALDEQEERNDFIQAMAARLKPVVH